MPVDEPPLSAVSSIAPNGLSASNPYNGADEAATKAKIKDKAPDGAVVTAPVDAGWDPRTIVESDLPKEDKGVGPVTERIMSAMLLEDPVGKREDEGLLGAGSGVTGTGPKMAAAGGKSAANYVSGSVELEGRIRQELKSLGLMSEEEVSVEWIVRIGGNLTFSLDSHLLDPLWTTTSLRLCDDAKVSCRSNAQRTSDARTVY